MRGWAAWALVAALAVGSCAGGDEERLTVSAAASLAEAFTDLATTFEAAHPGVDVRLNLAGSQRLASQLLAGASADVFASADEVQLQRVVDAGLVDGPTRTVATNSLVVVVAPRAADRVTALADLARPDVTVVLAADEVPAGRYAREALDASGVTVRPASLEGDVRAVLAKVALGEADAGIVYRSDVEAAPGDVAVFPVPGTDAIARYPVAALTSSALARAFVELAVSPAGREVLIRHGFGAP